MRRARPNELKEQAFPVMTVRLSEAELGEWFPIPFDEVNDPWAAPEPSLGALINLEAGEYAVLDYGRQSNQLIVRIPANLDATSFLASWFREIPMPRARVLWRREGARWPRTVAAKRVSASADLRGDDLSPKSKEADRYRRSLIAIKVDRPGLGADAGSPASTEEAFCTHCGQPLNTGAGIEGLLYSLRTQFDNVDVDEYLNTAREYLKSSSNKVTSFTREAPAKVAAGVAALALGAGLIYAAVNRDKADPSNTTPTVEPPVEPPNYDHRPDYDHDTDNQGTGNTNRT